MTSFCAQLHAAGLRPYPSLEQCRMHSMQATNVAALATVFAKDSRYLRFVTRSET